MVKRTHTIEKKNPQHNQIWEWEETPEFKDNLEEYLHILLNKLVKKHST